MSYDTAERSLASGTPARLYEFERGLMRWRYTNADREMEYGSRTFTPIAITDDGNRQTGEAQADACVIFAPASLPVARAYRAVPPAAEIMVTIRNLQVGEADALVSYVGSIFGVNFPSPEQARITCQSLGDSMDRPGLRLAWERGCVHSLYDHNCTVDRELFKTVTTVQSLDGESISSGAFDALEDTYFAGGYVEWSIGEGEVDQRGVIAHAGSVLTLLGGTAGLIAGQSVTAFAGCPRTISVCNSRFGNVPNYGGVPHLPGKSPFDGSPVF